MAFHRRFSKITALALAMVFLLSALPAGVVNALGSVQKAPVQLAVLSDIHYYPQSLMGDKGEAWQTYCEKNARQFTQGSAIIDAALGAIDLHAEKNGCKYLLIPGDMTKDGEYEGHTELAARLERFENETGIQVLVINGNHDINNRNTTSFKRGVQEACRQTRPAEFRSIYKNLGYDLAYHTYTPPAGEQAGMLSYSVRLDGGYRLLALDVCKYTGDATSDGEDQHETGGSISESLMAWALEEIAEAQSAGETVIGMMHHNLVNQFEIEQSMFQSFVVDNWMQAAEKLADAGMHFNFSGHMHGNNIASHISDNGQVMYDCLSASLTGYPNTFREVRFDNTGDTIKATYEIFDADCETPIEAEGVVYGRPYKNTYSFGKTYGQNGLAKFGVDMADTYLTKTLRSIEEQGGLYEFLMNSELDLEAKVDNLINGGLTIGDYEVFTSKNLLSFIEDLAGQLDEVYISQPQKLLDVLYAAALKLTSFPVSDYPCTKFIDTLGFGDATKPGTLEDAAYSVLSYQFSGDEDISGDLFIQDTIDYFRNRGGAEAFYHVLKDVVINDILEDSILGVLDFNPGTLLPKDTALYVVGVFLDLLVEAVFPHDSSYLNIINTILGIMPDNLDSISDIVDYAAGEYLTQSQFDSLGYTIAGIVNCLVEDHDPAFRSDLNVTLTYSGRVPVVPTAADYRLPSHIAVTFGDDAGTTRNIRWFTKYSVTGSDIELVPFSENPVFTGSPTTGPGIACAGEKVIKGYPGADFGIAGFLNYTFTLVRHSVSLTGLEPGKKYAYRVGDAARGWWSDTGVIETANGSDSFTFFHMTDEQSQNDRQYATWANTVNAAFELFPQSKFILSSGDQTDNPANIRQWKWLFDSAAGDLMNTAFMPTAGNHEDEGFVLDENFLLPAAPDQDRETGVYYSFDYNNAHFMVLNTNDAGPGGALGDAQLEWLKNDAAQSNAQWKIVSLHKAMYSNGSHYDDSDVKALRKQLGSLMPDLGIDLVLQGHDHVYLRTDAMDGNKIVKSASKNISFDGRDYEAKIEPAGSIYVISACAGVKNYKVKNAASTDLLFPRAQSIVEVDSPVFSAIRIDGSSMYFDAFSVDGGDTRRIDSFAVEKADTAVNPLEPRTLSGETDNGDAEPSGTDNAGEPTVAPLTVDSASETDTIAEAVTPPDTGNTGSRIYAYVFLTGMVCFVFAVAFKKKSRGIPAG